MAFRLNTGKHDDRAQLAALDRSQAIIEFGADGAILTANHNFLKTLGYSLEEIQGRNHSMFVPPLDRDRPSYGEFWNSLRRGEFQSSEFKRIGKGGREIWIQATYNPLLDAKGRVYKVVKFASDITEQKNKATRCQAQMDAINRSQAVIEFKIDGTIMDANDNFLNALGYRLEEIRGKHHSIFVTDQERSSEAYRRFWEKLRSGEYQAAEYKRIAKDGSEVWI